MKLNPEIMNRVTFLTGNAEIAERMTMAPALAPFDERIVVFLNDLSREVIRNSGGNTYSDVVTFGFWIRKSAVLGMKKRFYVDRKGIISRGKGIAFHIAPTNVPVNFAYSLVAGLMTGNANVVRVPTKDFPQVELITEALNKVLEAHPDLKPYVLCVRYDRDKDVNDLFSTIADIRLIWGGNQTISELRKSPLQPRAGEITFADRYSLAVIDSDTYLSIDDKNRVAEDFYNDTFISDQNACTSPRIIVWTGKQIENAKKVFWEKTHKLVEKKYTFQDIQGVNKLTKAFQVAAMETGVKIEEHHDNLIIRVKVPTITNELMDYRDNGGFFYEYDCNDIMTLLPVVNDKRCQTIAYIGSNSQIKTLIEFGVKGIDRVVPMGRTMDFDLIWDGYNLPAFLTRSIVVM